MKFTTWEEFNPDEHKNTTIVIANGLPLHKQLRIKRQIEGFSQQELAEMLGLEYFSRISSIENGKEPLENRKTPHLYLEQIKKYLYEEDYQNGELVK
ncbi:helix-turn-helix transcriptional regulator [Streptococcus pneumoniae]|nr:helix-turn-helix transcriptional regulator [Streptococcus pneumoniae]